MEDDKIYEDYDMKARFTYKFLKRHRALFSFLNNQLDLNITYSTSIGYPFYIKHNTNLKELRRDGVSMPLALRNIFCRSLGGSFSWAGSKEGIAYWSSLYKKFEDEWHELSKTIAFLKDGK